MPPRAFAACAHALKKCRMCEGARYQGVGKIWDLGLAAAIEHPPCDAKAFGGEGFVPI